VVSSPTERREEDVRMGTGEQIYTRRRHRSSDSKGARFVEEEKKDR
jgi:hypothetical protein